MNIIICQINQRIEQNGSQILEYNDDKFYNLISVQQDIEEDLMYIQIQFEGNFLESQYLKNNYGHLGNSSIQYLLNFQEKNNSQNELNVEGDLVDFNSKSDVLIWSIRLGKSLKFFKNLLSNIVNLSEGERHTMELTEKPFTGEYNDSFEDGVYVCRKCKEVLFLSINKFRSKCGWPSFDSEYNDSILKKLDIDGIRREILCKKCNAHLGHIFLNEGLSVTNQRYCVNSYPIEFISSGSEAIFASGCFWGTQYWFDKQSGVISTEIGYSGGEIDNPTYRQVTTGSTKHVECIRVKFDNKKIKYSDLVKLFFETHDSEQTDGQGVDIGSQYLSRIFYYNIAQKIIAEHMIDILENKGMKITTKVLTYKDFFNEEDEYHIKYYEKNVKIPGCHVYKKLY